MPEVTLALIRMSCRNITKEELVEFFPIIQRFINSMFGINEDISSVDDAWYMLFFHKSKTFKQMPPSSDALFQHLLRAVYQVRANI